MKTTTRIAPALAGLILALLVSTPDARAQDPGLRLGFTDDPDSFFIGGHLRFLGIGGVPRLMIEPSFDLGFGEVELVGEDLNFITFRLTGNVKYLFPVGREAFVYPLGGLSIYHIRIDDCEGDGCDETEFGLNIGGGFDYKMVGVEFWLGIDDIPDFTLLGTLTF